MAWNLKASIHNLAIKLGGLFHQKTATFPLSPGNIDRDLMLNFQSLGDNCEFGLVQRHFGAEPISPFRFAWTPLVALTKALDSNFQFLRAPENVVVAAHDFGGAKREYMVIVGEYEIVYHTGLFDDEISGEELLEQERTKLKFMGRKIIEDLTLGEKILVFKTKEEIDVQEVEALSQRLNRYGANTLLWITTASSDKVSGHVEQYGPSIMRGYIDRFARYESVPDTISLDAWRKICLNAWALQESRIQ